MVVVHKIEENEKGWKDDNRVHSLVSEAGRGEKEPRISGRGCHTAGRSCTQSQVFSNLVFFVFFSSSSFFFHICITTKWTWCLPSPPFIILGAKMFSGRPFIGSLSRLAASCALIFQCNHKDTLFCLARWIKLN